MAERFKNFGFTCKRCGTWHTVFNGSLGIPTQEEYDRLKEKTLEYVKQEKCESCKDIPTTLEMDKIFSEKDRENRHKCMFQCRECSKWTLQDMQESSPTRLKKPCQYCGKNNFDPTSGTSLRSHNPFSKRKPK